VVCSFACGFSMKIAQRGRKFFFIGSHKFSVFFPV
jgi:hypothetical protein